uniref:CSON010412 protein n=1 Tax=Culicoides sonorensis TaxID=179676 RepID=A0A336KIZ0_CULSO
MKPFKKRKILIEPEDFAENSYLSTKTIENTKNIVFSYEIQSIDEIKNWIKSLIKDMTQGHIDRLDIWKKIMLHVFYVRKSFTPKLRSDPHLNTFLIENLISKYFTCLASQPLHCNSHEIEHFFQILILFFSDSIEQILNFILFCDISNEISIEILINLITRMQISDTDEIPSYTRLILVTQKIMFLQKNSRRRSNLIEFDKMMLKVLPERVPITCNFVKFKRILNEICPGSDLTRDLLASDFKIDRITEFKEIYQEYFEPSNVIIIEDDEKNDPDIIVRNLFVGSLNLFLCFYAMNQRCAT